MECSGWLMLAVFFGIFNYVLCFRTENTVASFEIQSERSGILQIFWRTDSTPGYSEKQSVSVHIEPHIRHYELKIPAPAGSSFLRIDPLDKPGRMVIEKMSLTQPFHHPVAVDLQRLTAGELERSGLADFAVSAGLGLSFTSTGNDPWFVVQPVFSLDFSILIRWIVASLAIGSSLFILFNQQVLKGEKNNGVLWLEHSEAGAIDSSPWIDLLHKHFTDAKLVESVVCVSVRSYCFTFRKTQPDHFHLFTAEARQHFPSIRVRVQFNRSGEV